MDPLISLTGVNVSLGGQPVLKDIALTVEPGEVLGVVGPNGSGKTTLLRLLSTLVPPTAVHHGVVLGARLGSAEVYKVRRRIGLMGHAPALIPELTIGENLRHAAVLADIAPERIERVLDVVGLGAASTRRINASSHGMQRRTEVALLLLRRPELLLLDEPKSGLDAEASALIDSLIDRVTEDRGGAIIVSHEPSHLNRCQRIFRLPDGTVQVPG